MPYEEAALSMEEPETYEVEAVKSKTIHPINLLLQKNKKSSLSLIQILAKDNNMSIDKKFNIIYSNATHTQVLPGQLLACYGILPTGLMMCPICTDSIEVNDLIYHLTDSWREGHSLSLPRVLKLFAMNFWEWTYHANITPPWSYLGEKIEFK